MSYFITATGKRIDPSNITEGDICLEDIARHLTKICRFGGSLPLGVHYSVAQHSILMAIKAYYHNPTLADDNDLDYAQNVHLARACLLHDASEAYLGDMLTAVKALLPDYKELEHKVTNTILQKYLDASEVGDSRVWEAVAFMDKATLLDEALAFFPENYRQFSHQLVKEGHTLGPLGTYPQVETNPHQVKQLFLYWCKKLGITENQRIT